MLYEYFVDSVSIAWNTENLGVIVFIIFMALLLRASIGFGDGLTAIPLLSIFIDVKEAVPTVLFLSTTISFLSFYRDRVYIQWKYLRITTITALIGIPFGVLLIKYGNESLIKSMLGCILLFLSLYNILFVNKLKLESSLWGYIFGFLAGVLGSAYALRGIVFSVYGNLMRWDGKQFRGTISAFYILSGILIPFVYFTSGLITERVMGLYFILLPIAFFVNLISSLLVARFEADKYQLIIWWFLLFFCVFLFFG